MDFDLVKYYWILDIISLYIINLKKEKSEDLSSCNKHECWPSCPFTWSEGALDE